jgi:mono/diheme cytochrome c family protein
VKINARVIEVCALLVGVAAITAAIYAILQVGAGPATDPSAGRQAATSSAAPAATAAAPAAPSAAPAAPSPETATLVAAGAKLYMADACGACHSLDGKAGVGPTFKGLDGGQVTLADGSTVRVSHAYLKRSIAAPDAETVKGYGKGIMIGAISSYGLGGKPDEVRALVAYIASVK